jgi:hypothetical protein
MFRLSSLVLATLIQVAAPRLGLWVLTHIEGFADGGDFELPFVPPVPIIVVITPCPGVTRLKDHRASEYL